MDREMDRSGSHHRSSIRQTQKDKHGMFSFKYRICVSYVYKEDRKAMQEPPSRRTRADHGGG